MLARAHALSDATVAAWVWGALGAQPCPSSSLASIDMQLALATLMALRFLTTAKFIDPDSLRLFSR